MTKRKDRYLLDHQRLIEMLMVEMLRSRNEGKLLLHQKSLYRILYST